MLQSPVEAEPQRTAEELENSFPLDHGRRFSKRGGGALVDLVLAGMDQKEQRERTRGQKAENRRKASVEALLANIVAAHLNSVDPDRYVGVSFNRNDYNFSELGCDALKACREHLDGEGLIEVAPGFRRPDIAGDDFFGRRTRLRASPKLRRLIDGAELGKRPLTIPSSQLIRIKERQAGLAEMPPSIEASRTVVEAINRRLAATELGLPDWLLQVLRSEILEDEGEDHDAKERKRRYAGDLTATSIYRAFKGDWNSGGRFYGAWWMSFPRTLRPFITINGERIVELDYKTLHPLLLYRRADLSLDIDPYLVPPFGGKEMRELGKRTFNRLLNRNEPDPVKRLKMRAAKGDLAILGKKATFASYLASFVAQLSDLARWFGTGEGIRLQGEDSELALSVMDALERDGVPVLPIHDSFIVAAQHEEQLRLAMLDAFFERYGDVPLIERKGPELGAFQRGATVHN